MKGCTDIVLLTNIVAKELRSESLKPELKSSQHLLNQFVLFCHELKISKFYKIK